MEVQMLLIFIFYDKFILSIFFTFNPLPPGNHMGGEKPSSIDGINTYFKKIQEN